MCIYVCTRQGATQVAIKGRSSNQEEKFLIKVGISNKIYEKKYLHSISQVFTSVKFKFSSKRNELRYILVHLIYL